MRLLVVGQNPSTKTVNNQTLKRLADWMDQAGVLHWSFVNASSQTQNAYCSTSEDRQFLWHCVKYSGPARVIALGHHAASTLYKMGVPHVRIPHPSGLNRQLNNPRVIEDVVAELYMASKLNKYGDFRDLHQS